MFVALLPIDNRVLSIFSTASLGAQNGAKISPIGFKNTLLLTLISVNTLLYQLHHFAEWRVKTILLLDPDIE